MMELHKRLRDYVREEFNQLMDEDEEMGNRRLKQAREAQQEVEQLEWQLKQRQLWVKSMNLEHDGESGSAADEDGGTRRGEEGRKRSRRR